MEQQNKSKRLPIVLTLLSAAAITALAGIRVYQYGKDPDVAFLCGERGAEWIKIDMPFILKSRRAGLTQTVFRRQFETVTVIDNAQFTIRAMKQCRVVFDGTLLYSSSEDFDTWKQPHSVIIPFPVQPGTHKLVITVKSRNGPPALLAYSNELNILTGPGWDASLDGNRWAAAWLVRRAKYAEISRQFPTAFNALLSVLPWLAIVFAAVFACAMRNSRSVERTGQLSRWWPSPAGVRWVLLWIWVVMAVNNIFKIPPYAGFDVRGHFAYIKYVAENLSLPLVTEGWEMFQSPLYYILNVPLYALFIHWFDSDFLIKILRVLPLLCGLIQIEIVYRSARLVFPDKDDLQIIATIIGGLMPMHSQVCQVIGNEPLAGCLVSLLILLSLKLLMNQTARGQLFFAVLGLVWGLALLSKVSAILLAPLLVVVIIIYGRSARESVRQIVIKTALVFGVCFVVSGWYYIRNWVELGKPFVGNWETVSGIEWWQDPGYRTWTQLFSFGQSLIYPVCSGVVDFWDSIYSTLWLDGFLSSVIVIGYRPLWNIQFMLAGSLLSLIPTVLLFIGAVSPLRRDTVSSKKAILFAVGCIVIYFVAILDLYIRFPIYSNAKASFTLGLLPCYGLLVAAGAAPLLKFRFCRAFILAFTACWAAVAYLAYISG